MPTQSAPKRQALVDALARFYQLCRQMAFGPTFSLKPRRSAEHVRPVTGALVRIVLLGILATFGAAWGIYAYYTHAFRPAARTASPASASASVIEVQIEP